MATHLRGHEGQRPRRRHCLLLAPDPTGMPRTGTGPVRLTFGDDQVTVLSLTPNTPAEAERVERDLAALVDDMASQVLPLVLASVHARSDHNRKGVGQ